MRVRQPTSRPFSRQRRVKRSRGRCALPRVSTNRLGDVMRQCSRLHWYSMLSSVNCRSVSQTATRPTSLTHTHTHTHTHTRAHPFNGPLSGTTRVSRYQIGKTDLDFTEAIETVSGSWHQLGHMQVCISLQTDNHASTALSFLQTGCPSCRPANSIKALN